MEVYSRTSSVSATQTSTSTATATDTRTAADPRTLGTTVTATSASLALRMLDRMGGPESARILVFEPDSGALANTLRQAGFSGEIHALVRQSPSELTELYAAYDETLVLNWTAPAKHGDVSETPYAVVIAADVVGVAGSEGLHGVAQWLGQFVESRGYLIVGSAARSFSAPGLTALMRASGFVLARDADSAVAGSERWALTTYENCGREESALTGDVHQLTLADIERPDVFTSMVEIYQEVFSGDDWHEWMRCTRPGCGRQYSRREVDEVLVGGRCLCGASESLVHFHSPAEINAKMRAELADPERSRCYVRTSEGNAVDGFIWGYIAPKEAIAHELTRQLGAGAIDALDAEMSDLLKSYSTVAGDARVYYQSEIGVAERTRSLSLFRWLCRRVLEFADDQQVAVVVTRTSRASSAYPLLLGIGMRTILQYDDSGSLSGDGAAPADASGAAERPERDQRVVLGGSVRDIMQVFSRESDRRLALRIARNMPRQRG